jgi:uncharacterized protein (DUF1697 family)
VGGPAVTAFVALLRAVNVGGNNLIRMAALRSVCEEIGFRNVKTLLQSGNVVFDAKGNDNTVAKRLAGAIEASHGFRPAIAVRTADEIADAMKRNPFGAEAKSDPTFLVIVFMAGPPTSGANQRVAAIEVDGERLHLSGRELHAYYANGQGKSKVTNAVLEKALGVPATARNWNTVTKLLELARSLD